MSDRQVLVERIKAGQLALLIGTDLPAGLGGASNQELAQGLGVSSLAETTAPQWRYTQHLIRQLPPNQPPTPLHSALASLPVLFCMTSAYDDRLATALGAHHTLNLLIDDSDTWLPSRQRDLIKLCGDVARPPTLVVTRDQYSQLPDSNRAQLLARMTNWLKDKTFLLIGCHPDEAGDFTRCLYGEVLKRHGGFGAHAYLAWPDPSTEQIARWRERGVTLLDAQPQELVTSLAKELEGVTVARPQDQELAAIKALVQVLGHAPTQNQINAALAPVPAHLRPRSIGITLRLWLADDDKLCSILDVNYSPNVTHYYGKPVQTNRTLSELREWAEAAEQDRYEWETPNGTVQAPSIQLFEAMLGTKDRQAYQNALRDSQLLDISPFIVLALDDKPGRLAPFPWELLHDGVTGESGFVALRYPLYRLPTSVASLDRVTARIKRALIVAADPTQQLAQIDQEAATIKQTLEGQNVQTDAILSGDARVSDPDQIKDLVRDGGYQLVHFIGHGHFDANEPAQSLLMLGRAQEQGKFMTAPALGQVARQSKLTLVFLSMCEGAGAAQVKAHPWQEAGLADALVRAGVPAVVGMRWAVGDKNCRRLAERFYSRLQDNSLERALLIARQTLADNHQSDWANPVLLKRHGVLD